MKKKMGRPNLPKGTAHSVLFAVRVAPNEADKIERAVKKSGLKKPQWARKALIHAAEKK
ncbi:MAG TPA: hypothetical protein VKU37_05330 [Verrucomicrobiae bacterium]|nr:hypothetical protein [Verrucomicrobiae bacterium]